MASSPQVSLNGFPELLLDALVSNILDVCPTLTPTFLHELGSRVHASTLKAVFSTLDIPDDVRYFSHEKQGSLLSKHPVSAVLLNPARYAHIVKRIVVNEAELPSAYRSNTGALGLITINEDDEESDEEMVTKHGGRVAVEPMRGEDLTSLLSLCGDLESFVWRSSNPPPDGIIEVLSAQCPKLSSFIFRPDPQLRAASIADKVSDISLPLSRGTVVKWDAPSFRISPGLSLTQLRLTRLSQSGSQALACFLKRLGDESLLEDVSLDLVWFDDVCEPLVKAGRRIKKLQLGTSGTKLTDKDIVMIFEGCEALEDFALVEAEARLSRKLWSKIESIPPRLRKFSIQLSESGPHHSWTADHLESFASLKLDTVTHLSIRRLLPFPQLTSSGNELEYDSRIDGVAALKPIPSDVVESIREMPSLINLQCDWWSWKLDDVKALADKCTKLEHLELALDAPFLKLLSMTSIFTPLTQLRHFAICIPPAHSPGLVPPLLSPSKLPIHPLTPAASPVRRRTSLPSPVSDFASQVFVGEDAKVKEQGDISFPPLREIKKFVKKCPKLLELEWYGRNARGRWLISRPLNGSSKLGPNVSVEYIPPVASAVVWTRATLEKAALDFVTSGNGSLSHNIPRQGQAWTGPKAEEFRVSLEKDKEQSSSSVTVSAVGGTRDKSSKAQVSSSNNKRRERVSISSSESTSGSSGTSTGSPGTKLVQPEMKTYNIIPSPISPISPLSQSLCMENTMDSESSPIEDQLSPYQSPSLSRSIPDESPIRIDNNYREGPRSRRATLPDINTIPTTTTSSGMSTFSYSSSAFPRAFRMNNQSRFETRNSSIGGKNNGNTISADHPRQDSPRTIRGSTATSTTTSNPRGRGSFYPHGAPRRGGGFGRGIVGGDNNKRGFVNGGFVSVGRSVNGGGSSNNNGHSRRGNTASIP